MSNAEVNQYFVAILREYEMLGLMGLGKIADPTQNEAKVDLMRTQFAIGVLEMLEQKTGGNLADLERQELQRILTTLRLNYVEEMKHSQEPAAGETSAAASGAAPAPDEPDEPDEPNEPDESAEDQPAPEPEAADQGGQKPASDAAEADQGGQKPASDAAEAGQGGQKPASDAAEADQPAEKPASDEAVQKS